MKVLVVILIILALISVGFLTINQVTFSNTMNSVIKLINDIGIKSRDALRFFNIGTSNCYKVVCEYQDDTYTFLIYTKQKFNSDNDLIINKATIYSDWLFGTNISDVQFMETSINYGLFQFKNYIGGIDELITFNNARYSNITFDQASELLTNGVFKQFKINGGYDE